MVARGVAHVPQGRRVVPDFTVEENLRAAAYSRGGRDVDGDIATVLEACPTISHAVLRTAIRRLSPAA